MTTAGKRNVVSFAVGVVFAIGLGLGGMTQPHKVIGFLDPFAWDPSLLFVMIGAVGVHVIAYPIVVRRRSPLFDVTWHVPTRRDLTLRLVGGSAIFGLGWGLAGYCPGPAVASTVGGSNSAVVFVVSMIAGMLIFRRVSRSKSTS